MNRAEFERWYALDHGRTIAEMRKIGYVSAPCPCDLDGCPGWQAIAIPIDATPQERKAILAGLVQDSIKRFGGST